MSGSFSIEDPGSEEFQDRIDLIRHKLKFIGQRPKVAFVETLSPLAIAGKPIGELIEIAGGVPVLVGNEGSAYTIDFAMLQAAAPDILIVAPQSFTIARTLQEMHLLFGNTEWNDLKAVQNDSIYIADGNSYFYREGQQTPDKLEILAEIINPKQFVFGYEETAWIKFSIK